MSVCPPVCRTRQLWRNERNLCPHSYIVWKDDACSYAAQKIVCGTRPLLPEILGQVDPPPSKQQFTIRAFQWAEDEQRTLPVSTSRGAQICKLPWFLWKKVCYQVSLCENFLRQSWRHSLAYPTEHKWLVSEVHFYLKLSAKVTLYHPAKTTTSYRYSLVASQQ